MTAGIVATGLLFFPAAPFFLFMHGKDITVPKGAEVTAYRNGDVRLETAKFIDKPAASEVAAAAPASSPQADPPAIATGSVELRSTPDGAEVSDRKNHYSGRARQGRILLHPPRARGKTLVAGRSVRTEGVNCG